MRRERLLVPRGRKGGAPVSYSPDDVKRLLSESDALRAEVRDLRARVRAIRAKGRKATSGFWTAGNVAAFVHAIDRLTDLRRPLRRARR